MSCHLPTHGMCSSFTNIPATLLKIKGFVQVSIEMHRNWRWNEVVIMVALLCLPSIAMEAQTAYFTGGQSVVGSGLNVPLGVAVDRAGNVYIADSGNGRVLKETPSVGGFTQSTVVGSGLSNPYGVAVDGAGNVYVADTYNNRVLEETPSAGGYTQSTVGSGTPYTPLAVAVEGTGNVYILGDQGLILKETPSSGSYTETTLPTTSLSAPAGVAVDASGNIYVTDYNANVVLKETLSSGSYIQSTMVGSGLSNPYGVAVDGNGNVYIGDSQHNRVVRLQTAAENFGVQAIGSASQVIPMSFTFTVGGTISRPTVLTLGKASLDFADAGTGTCTTNGVSYTYAAGDSCTVNVAFTPMYAGGRCGAAELLDGSGGVIATGYVYGVGSGPQITYTPGTQSTVVGSGLNHPMGISIDGNGSIYFVDITNNRVLKETLSGGSYTQSTVGTGLSAPLGVVVDGAGNVYIADSGHNRVLKETLSGGSYTQSAVVPSGLYDPYAVGVDGSGNVYIADTYNARVLKETPSAAG